MYKNYFHYSSKQKKCYNLIKINCLSVIFVINHLKTKSNNVRKTCLFCLEVSVFEIWVSETAFPAFCGHFGAKYQGPKRHFFNSVSNNF